MPMFLWQPYWIGLEPWLSCLVRPERKRPVDVLNKQTKGHGINAQSINLSIKKEYVCVIVCFLEQLVINTI
jgi:hypothetical protein